MGLWGIPITLSAAWLRGRYLLTDSPRFACMAVGRGVSLPAFSFGMPAVRHMRAAKRIGVPCRRKSLSLQTKNEKYGGHYYEI